MGNIKSYKDLIVWQKAIELVAEGSGRRSSKEWQQFYSISYGSTLELETQLIISRDLFLAPMENFNKSFILIEEVSKIIRTISNNLKKKGEKTTSI